MTYLGRTSSQALVPGANARRLPYRCQQAGSAAARYTVLGEVQ
jgi:hypothetical protein